MNCYMDGYKFGFIAWVMILLLTLTSINTMAAEEAFSEEYKKALIDLHSSIIRDLANHPETLVQLKHSARTESSIVSLIRQDIRWHTSKELRERITHNSLALRFRSLIAKPQFSFAEIMLTDSFGGLIAAFPETTDFWQGDEEKFKQPVIKAGAYISNAEWDESTRAFSFFVSVPISKDDEFLGVLIAGIDVTKAYLIQMPLEELVKVDIKNMDIQ